MIKKYVSGPFSTNTYLVVKGKEVVIVDPGLGFEKYAQEIKETYNVLGVLLTHGHVDHINAIGCFECPVYISEAEKEFLFDETMALYPLMRMHKSYDIKKLDLHFVIDNEEIILGEMTFTVISTPGHTKGSVCYKYYNNLFSGDTLFYCSQGRTDFPTGNDKQLRESLKKIISLCNDNTSVYPGHDEKTTIKFERQYNPFVLQALK